MADAAITIIKNIFQFMKILNQASGEGIQEWDEASLKNALDWAVYCQEVHLHLKGGEFEKDVNKQLVQMMMLLEPVSCRLLNVDSLGEAKLLLVEALMSNPNLPQSSRDLLTRLPEKCEEDGDILLKVQEKASRLQCLSGTYEDVCKLLDFSDSGNRVERSSSHGARCLAEFMRDHLMTVARNSRKRERFHSYCHAVCDRLASSTTGSLAVYNLLKLQAECRASTTWESEACEVVDSELLSWLRKVIKDDIHSCPLLVSDAGDVARMVCSSEDLFVIYLEALSEWTDSFSPHAESNTGIVWRSYSGDLEQLTSRFQALLWLNLPSQTHQRVLEVITDKVRASDFTAWQALARRLLQQPRI